MRDIIVLFNFLSLSIGAAAISVSIFIYKNYKKRSLKLFISLILSLLLIQSSITLITYANRINNPSAFINILSGILDTVGTTLSSYFGILFINTLLGRNISRKNRLIIFTFAFLQFLAIVMHYFLNFTYLNYATKLSVILVILYEILLTLLSYKQIGNKDLKSAVNKLVYITLIFLPLFILEAYHPQIALLKDKLLLKLMTLPAYFFAINIYILLFAKNYFNSPAFIEENKLTEYFIQKYTITNKEVEVIELLLIGLTYKQIAERLFIANKTVDNHIQNIYRKLDVSSKIQLFNLIRSKEK